MGKNNILEESMIFKDVSYHDAVITEAYKDGDDFVLKFKDGWEPEQIDELRFVNADTFFEYELTDRIVYQFGSLDHVTIEDGFNSNKFIFEIYVWYKGSLTEVVNIEASNIITKIYDKDNVKNEDLLKFFGNEK